jgi:cell division septation protein DedD
MPKSLNIVAFALVPMIVALGCETTKKVGTPLDRAREFYEDGDMDDAFALASEAAASTDAATAQRGQLVAGLSAMDMGRPDAESWLLKASNGPDRESAGTALASMATIQERSGRIEAAAQSMHRASMMLSGSEQSRARSEAQRLAKAVPSKSKPSSDAAQASSLGSRSGAQKASGTNKPEAPKKAAKADPANKSQAQVAKPSSEKWTLQAGAFESKKKADVLAAELEKETDARGLPVPEVVTVKVRGKTMYRVQVGIYDSRELAKAALQSWGRKGILLGTTD